VCNRKKNLNTFLPSMDCSYFHWHSTNLLTIVSGISFRISTGEHREWHKAENVEKALHSGITVRSEIWEIMCDCAAHILKCAPRFPTYPGMWIDRIIKRVHECLVPLLFSFLWKHRWCKLQYSVIDHYLKRTDTGLQCGKINHKMLRIMQQD
jgi:hypothetical protein